MKAWSILADLGGIQTLEEEPSNGGLSQQLKSPTNISVKTYQGVLSKDVWKSHHNWEHLLLPKTYEFCGSGQKL